MMTSISIYQELARANSTLCACGRACEFVCGNTHLVCDILLDFHLNEMKLGLLMLELNCGPSFKMADRKEVYLDRVVTPHVS